MGLHRLIYKSKRSENTKESDIQDILNSCEKKNPKYDISGVLIHSNHTFFQYLEGDGEHIKALYDKIKLDKRHFDCHLEVYEEIEKKIFPNWSMGYKDLNSQLIEFNTDTKGHELLALERLIYGANTMDDEGIKMLRDQLS